MSSFTKEVVIDGRGHILGRLAGIVAKELLNGQKVTVVRCENINMSNTLFRQQLKYLAFKRKTNNVNPKHGPFHYRAPCKIFYRVVSAYAIYFSNRVLFCSVLSDVHSIVSTPNYSNHLSITLARFQKNSK